MKDNIDFLQGSDFKKLIDHQRSFFDKCLTEELEAYLHSIDTIEGEFRKLVLKAYGFKGIDLFVDDSKRIFKSILTLPLYESFLDILKAIFMSDDIQIHELHVGLVINVVNKNDKLLAYYVDDRITYYKDGNDSHYKGFKAGDFSSLDWFFQNLLKRFLTAGTAIIMLKINNKKSEEVVNFSEMTEDEILTSFNINESFLKSPMNRSFAVETLVAEEPEVEPKVKKGKKTKK